MVYVLNRDGQPLMPTSRHGKVRHLLETGRAKVVKRCPFTIRLQYESTTHTQNLTLGIDTGSGIIGTAVCSEDGRVVYMAEVTVRNNISNTMTQRRKYRRNRRNRKTRYRKPRFLNRGNSRRTDRFSPTVTSKIHSHIREVEAVRKMLPITTVVFETGKFDMHLMQHEGETWNRHWGYQRGRNYGFENTKAMVLDRDGYKCQCCKGKHQNSKLEVHHIIFRSNGGSDEAENLVTLCHTCHMALHRGEITLTLTGKHKRQLHHATQMNCIRKQLLRIYPEATETFGYMTKANRLALGVGKDHYLDACVIASGGKVFKPASDRLYRKCDVADGDYQKTKGIRSEQPITTGKIQGFRKFDRVEYFGQEYFIKGRMSTGYAILMDIDGNKIDFSGMPKSMKTPKLSNCKRIAARSSQMIYAVAI